MVRRIGGPVVAALNLETAVQVGTGRVGTLERGGGGRGWKRQEPRSVGRREMFHFRMW